jgi:hypothetical protein
MVEGRCPEKATFDKPHNHVQLVEFWGHFPAALRLLTQDASLLRWSVEFLDVFQTFETLPRDATNFKLGKHINFLKDKPAVVI